MRNIKRRNTKINVKINIKGHQYAADKTNENKRTDPTRKVALKI